MLKAYSPKNNDINPEPILEAIFFIYDERSMDEFWFFMMREEGITKSIEFILHICSEVLAIKKENIAIKCRVFNYISHFIVSDKLFCELAIKRYERIKHFISIEISDDSVHIKSIRDLDVMDCNFCKAMQDEDIRLLDKSISRLCGKAVISPGCEYQQKDFCNKITKNKTTDFLTNLEDEICVVFDAIGTTKQTQYLHPLSIKLFLYSQRLLSIVKLYELSISAKELSFAVQKLYFAEQSKILETIRLCKKMFDAISRQRKNIRYIDLAKQDKAFLLLKIEVQEFIKKAIANNG